MEEKQKIAIITDSCADVPEELRVKYNIFVLPMIISCQDGEYRDGLDIHAEDIYERLKAELPKTSTPTGEDIENLLEQLEREGYDKAIAVMISGGLSGTVNHMRLSVEEAALEVCVIDSHSASIGNGVIVLQAAIWREEGMSYTELCDKVKKLCANTRVFFSIDTLEYLQKGGRIGKATALVGTALSIKPILSFDEEGEIYTPAKVRGHKLVEKKLLSLVEEQKNASAYTKKQYNLVVADGGVPEEGDELEQRMKEMFPDYRHLFRAKIGAALSAYLGPGLLGAGIQFLE
ncbi:MAG: DegV family protein [Bacteroidales bacterium]|nr:DegV family protein [Clostridium sp.]MCM1205015.1 DegV family protein [Bacteroidales bacterium]